MLAELRASIKADLIAGDVKALDYLGEEITPPCALVVPGEPYLQRPNGDERIPFRKVRASVDVMLLVSRETGAKSAAKAIDELIEAAYAALKHNHTIRSASRPGVVTTVSGSKFVGSVLSIEALAEEPTNG